MSELKDTESAASKFDSKLHKLIKRAKKNSAGCFGLPLFKTRARRADVRAMINV
jgi:hypothetical protein